MIDFFITAFEWFGIAALCVNAFFAAWAVLSED